MPRYSRFFVQEKIVFTRTGAKWKTAFASMESMNYEA